MEKRTVRFLFCALSFTPLVAFAQKESRTKLTKPNIVFILADDLGWTDLGVMGSDYYEIPNIDRLAAEGLLFDNAYAAAANSAPSRACMMTGMYTPRHGVYTVSPPDRGDRRLRKLIPIANTDDVRADFVVEPCHPELDKDGGRQHRDHDPVEVHGRGVQHLCKALLQQLNADDEDHD